MSQGSAAELAEEMPAWLSKLKELVRAVCFDRDKDEMEAEYQQLGADSPYRETVWGTSSYESMMRDKKCQVANANLALNRFSNILPFDQCLAPCSKGYINASVVSPVGRVVLIAQGPMEDPDTREAFWITALENNISLVVNLAPFGPECADYILPATFGSVTVQVLSETQLTKACVVRTLDISAPGIPKRKCDHIQFDDWPNYSLPYDVKEITAVVKHTLDCRETKTVGQTLVNCSGGVGRSGTFVAMLSSWEHLALLAQQGVFQDCSVSTFKTQLVAIVKESVEAIRSQRHPWLVEGVGQYALIFEVLAELCAF